MQPLYLNPAPGGQLSCAHKRLPPLAPFTPYTQFVLVPTLHSLKGQWNNVCVSGDSLWMRTWPDTSACQLHCSFNFTESLIYFLCPLVCANLLGMKDEMGLSYPFTEFSLFNFSIAWFFFWWIFIIFPLFYCPVPIVRRKNYPL